MTPIPPCQMPRRVGLFTTLLTVVTMGFGGMLCLDCLCEFYTEYTRAASLVESESPLFVNCQNSTFFHMLGQHTDLCVKVQSNHRIGPFMMALQKVAARANAQDLALALLHLVEARLYVVVALSASAALLAYALFYCFGRPEPALWRNPPYYPMLTHVHSA